jgi:exodeoxyribonuclease-5
MITLNPEQHAADVDIRAWLADPAKDTFTLMGSAGTGKTTLVSHFISRMAGSRRIVYLAPTHRAVAVMKDRLQPVGLDRHCHTIAKGTNRILAKDDIRPYLVKRKGTNRVLKEAAIVVVDESSWVDDKMYETLIREAAEYNVKILFVGDPYQLPPVKGKATWPMFDAEDTPLIELRTVVRQAEGSPIIMNAQRFRSRIERGKLTTPRIREGVDAHGRGVHLIHPRAVLDGMVSTIASHTNVRLVAWRNETIKNWSDAIRRELYGVEPGGYWVKGERVTNLRMTSGPSKTYMYSHQQSTVESVGEPGELSEYRLKYRSIILKTDAGTVFPAKEICDPDALDVHLRAIANEAERAPEGSEKRRDAWRRYHTLKECFVELTAAYVSTVHSAQGQTLDCVWIDLDDIYESRCFGMDRMNRMLYVAISRASNSVFVASEVYD